MNNALFLIICICAPLIMAAFGSCRPRDTLGKITFLTLLTMVIANGAMSAMALLMGSRANQYTLLLVNWLMSAVMSFLAVPMVRSRRFAPAQLLKGFCAIGVCVAVYSVLTLGQTCIHGDTAAASLLTRAQVEHGSLFPDSWYYADGDLRVFSVQTFTTPFVILMKDQSLARMMGSALLLIVAALAMVLHSKKALKDDSWVISVPVCLLFLAGAADSILYQADCTPRIIWFSVLPWMFYRVWTAPKDWKNAALFALLTAIVVTGGNGALTEVVLPLWGAYFVLTYLRLREQAQVDRKQEITQMLRVSAVILGPALVGLLIFRGLRQNVLMEAAQREALFFAASSEACVENVFRYLENILSCFGFSGGVELLSPEGIRNVLLMLMCLIVVFLVPVLQGRRLKQEPEYVRFFYTFAVLHNLILFVQAVFFSGSQEPQHLVTGMIALAVVSARYIYVYWISQAHYEKYLWSGLFAAAVLVASVTMVLSSAGWQEKVNAQEEVTRQLAEQGFTKGYADFRTAYGQEVYSDFTVRFGGLYLEDGKPQACCRLVEEDVFEVQNIPTFLMLTEEENRQLAGTILEYFEEPLEHMLISGYHIYTFDYDIASDLR